MKIKKPLILHATEIMLMFTGNLSTSDTMLLEELKDFSNQTSIHGLGQIANERAPILKRIIWFTIFVGSLAYAGQQLASIIKGILTFRIR